MNKTDPDGMEEYRINPAHVKKFGEVLAKTAGSRLIAPTLARAPAYLVDSLTPGGRIKALGKAAKIAKVVSSSPIAKIGQAGVSAIAGVTGKGVERVWSNIVKGATKYGKRETDILNGLSREIKATTSTAQYSSKLQKQIDKDVLLNEQAKAAGLPEKVWDLVTIGNGEFSKGYKAALTQAAIKFHEWHLY